ncbi:CHAT domain-containing protein [Streptacidiphilus sp. 4-A2]|nr:CHAT domain-containing protein [Streptacidiphilus sp. 4-A2]
MLVPCGNLGVVPWHAARERHRDSYRYACQYMVVSYAASGSQLLLTVGREPLAVGSAPVLVADPRLELTHAEREISALHAAFYPQARLFGDFFEPPAPLTGSGTPAEVLALLASGDRPVSLLHVASHGSAGPRPTVSALSLAFPGDRVLAGRTGRSGGAAGRGHADRGAVARRVGRGQRRAAQRAARGPQCLRDGSEHPRPRRGTHPDDRVPGPGRTQCGGVALENLRRRLGADDGGLPPLRGRGTARSGPGPPGGAAVDVDPQRRLPGSVCGALASDARLPGLDRPSVWAAFIHQGHPGSSPADRTATGGTA